jgi:hypothetical protein
MITSLIRKLQAVGLVLATAAAVSLSAPRPASAAATFPYGTTLFHTDIEFYQGPGTATSSVAAWTTLVSFSVQAVAVNKRMIVSFFGSPHAEYSSPYITTCALAVFLDGTQVGPMSQGTLAAGSGTSSFVALSGALNTKIPGGGSGGGWHSVALELYSAAGCTMESNSSGVEYELFEDAPSGVFGP